MGKNYLLKLFKSFLSYISSSEKNEKAFNVNDLKVSQEIDKNVEGDELLVRAIIRPLFFSSKKVQINAVLPPVGKHDVSLVRYRYKDAQFCKTHGQSLVVKDNFYCGLAVFKSDKVAEVNAAHDKVKAEVVASPLDDQNEVRSDWPIYVDDIGFPAHGSLLYDKPPKERGEPNPPYIAFAKEFVKKLQYFSDSKPDEHKWEEGDLFYNKD